MQAFEELMTFQRDTEALGRVAGRQGWDQETMMPRGSADQRGEEMAALEHVLHERRTDPRVGSWLSQIEDAGLTEVQAAHMRQIRRSYERATKVPSALAAQIARTISRAQIIWIEARAANDFKAFAPVLEEIVALRREEGAALAGNGSLYDALLDDYEAGAKAKDLEAMFSRLRPRLVALREAVLGLSPSERMTHVFDPDLQMALSRELATAFGYDFNRGRLDKAVHPFSSGSGDDVRITTRTVATDPFNCLYSTIHETGHAVYEQNIDTAYRLTPLGRGASMGVHESQSRIFENQLGRSRAFTGWLFKRMRDTFGDFGIPDEEAFYKQVNRLHKGYIRTEADEVQYNLHVLLRFDLERQIVSGALSVRDLEEAWNARFEADFGYAVDRPSNGVLQDVHWSAGMFGYFPTYTLGNVYAGCLNEALRREVPSLDSHLAKGDTSAATAWLRDAVQQHGRRYRPRQVIEGAYGEAPSEEPLLTYLETKFSDLYGLARPAA